MGKGKASSDAIKDLIAKARSKVFTAKTKAESPQVVETKAKATVYVVETKDSTSTTHLCASSGDV